MATEGTETVHIRDDFYRDSFGKVAFIILSIIIGIISLIAFSIYLYLHKPPPVFFKVMDKEWRIQAPVELSKPYLSEPDLLQWVANTFPRTFNFDFLNYNEQLQTASQYFTSDGWRVFLNQLNIYANYNNVQTNRLFVSGSPAGAPTILNQGLLSGRYAWWVQMPITVNYAGNQSYAQSLTMQILVVRISTLNNLSGVGIDNVILVKSKASQLLDAGQS